MVLCIFDLDKLIAKYAKVEKMEHGIEGMCKSFLSSQLHYFCFRGRWYFLQLTMPFSTNFTFKMIIYEKNKPHQTPLPSDTFVYY